MEKLPGPYADFLHAQETNPYSMQVLNQETVQIWVINLLTDEASEMMQPVLTNLEMIVLDSYSDLIVIDKIEVDHLSNQQLLELFSTESEQQTFSIRFLTPTSFKSAGEYVIFPTTRLIFQSLMQKYSRLFPELNTFDEELLDYISEHSRLFGAGNDQNNGSFEIESICQDVVGIWRVLWSWNQGQYGNGGTRN